jgi:uncharacterized damage-inducible protein DinB
MEPDADHWQALLETDPDPDQMFTFQREDGTKAHATWGVRLAQAIDHGTDHRSQLCTGLTSFGIEPPEMDVWAWGWATGRFSEEAAASAE